MDDWDDDLGTAPVMGGAGDPLVNTEYARMQERYIDAGYREGITNGKLDTLQEGFDSAFAASVPPSRRLGQLRGRANALLAIAVASSSPSSSRTPSSGGRARRSSPPAGQKPPAAFVCASKPEPLADSEFIADLRVLVADLARVKRNDILPPDLERAAHDAEEHGGPEDENAFELERTDAREMEGLEDMMSGMGPNTEGSQGGLREQALLDALENRVSAAEQHLGATW